MHTDIAPATYLCTSNPPAASACVTRSSTSAAAGSYRLLQYTRAAPTASATSPTACRYGPRRYTTAAPGP